MKLEKYKLVYLILFFVIILLVGLYLKFKTNTFSPDKVTTAYTDCTVLNEKTRPNQMLIWGRVVEINKDNPEWIISTIELCDNPDLNPKKISIKAYTPTAPNLFYSGKKFETNGKPSYQWQYEAINDFNNFVEINSLVVVRAESLISKDNILNRFTNIEDFNCEEESICYPLINFIEKYNDDQVELIQNIKTKNNVGLLKNSYQNKNIVYSNMIGKIDSHQELQEYADNLIIW